MLEKPQLSDSKIISVLRKEYGLDRVQLTFLPLGADPNAAVYRVDSDDSYFLKVKRGNLDNFVALPKFLKDRGLQQVLAPLATKSNDTWVNVSGFHLLLYPFVKGKNGFESELQGQQWISLGSALSQLHSVALPPNFSKNIRRESFSPIWRHRVNNFLRQAPARNEDDISTELLALLDDKANEIRHITNRAEELSLVLKSRSLEHVLCHADIHAGNILTTATGELYLVDWDNPILAPKERDLMFVGGGVGGIWNRAAESALFYQGYGEVKLGLPALSYYRYERIVEDIVVTCEEILSVAEGDDDRKESLRSLKNQFLPDNVVTIAHKTYDDLSTQRLE